MVCLNTIISLLKILSWKFTILLIQVPRKCLSALKLINNSSTLGNGYLFLMVILSNSRFAKEPGSSSRKTSEISLTTWISHKDMCRLTTNSEYTWHFWSDGWGVSWYKCKNSALPRLIILSLLSTGGRCTAFDADIPAPCAPFFFRQSLTWPYL